MKGGRRSLECGSRQRGRPYQIPERMRAGFFDQTSEDMARRCNSIVEKRRRVAWTGVTDDGARRGRRRRVSRQRRSQTARPLGHTPAHLYLLRGRRRRCSAPLWIRRLGDECARGRARRGAYRERRGLALRGYSGGGRCGGARLGPASEGGRGRNGGVSGRLTVRGRGQSDGLVHRKTGELVEVVAGGGQHALASTSRWGAVTHGEDVGRELDRRVEGKYAVNGATRQRVRAARARARRLAREVTRRNWPVDPVATTHGCRADGDS